MTYNFYTTFRNTITSECRGKEVQKSLKNEVFPNLTLFEAFIVVTLRVSSFKVLPPLNFNYTFRNAYLF